MSVARRAAIAAALAGSLTLRPDAPRVESAPAPAGRVYAPIRNPHYNDSN